MKNKGFTILELIVVVSIITILASLLIPAGGQARNRARQAKARSHIAALELAITAFQTDFGFYPTTQYTGSSPNFSVTSGATAETNNANIVELLTGFTFAGSRSPSNHTLVLSSVWNGPYLELDEADVKDTNGTMDGTLRDPWGNAYEMTLALDDNRNTAPTNNVYSFDLRSYGQDGASGGGDDITNY